MNTSSLDTMLNDLKRIFGPDGVVGPMGALQILESEFAPSPKIVRVEWIERVTERGRRRFRFDHALRQHGSTYRSQGKFEAIVIGNKVIVHPAIAGQLRRMLPVTGMFR